ncbi:hypothetical protein [Paraherbaspirillum soli]|uniref:Uncharacterized protein n=1 Tax=Paraherbaspirillum soli TaxID=631222 RepID=A0ABW0M3N1_9BURK
MHISRSDRETSIFVLKWSDIEKLIGAIGKFLPITSISAACVDRLDRAFADIEELKKFNNSKRAAIIELNFVARDATRSQRFSILLNTDERRNVRVSLEADEATAIKVNDLYEDFLDSVRPWYSWIARADWYLVVLGIGMLIQLGLLGIVMLKATSISFTWPKDGIPIRELLKGFLVGLSPVFIGIAMSRVRGKFFPTGTFAFGDGENRHHRNEVIRTVLIAAFVVSIVSSVVVSWFQ